MKKIDLSSIMTKEDPGARTVWDASDIPIAILVSRIYLAFCGSIKATILEHDSYDKSQLKDAIKEMIVDCDYMINSKKMEKACDRFLHHSPAIVDGQFRLKRPDGLGRFYFYRAEDILTNDWSVHAEMLCQDEEKNWLCNSWAHGWCKCDYEVIA